jgi:hypothetical protein
MQYAGMAFADAPWFNTRGIVQYWTDPGSDYHIAYRAMLVTPVGYDLNSLHGTQFPLAVYFPGLAEKPETIMAMESNWRTLAPEPFILVSPARPKKMWWFIDNDSDYGWVTGNFCPDLVTVFCRWLEALAGQDGVDPDRIGLFGFSGGAYAVVEILAHGCIPVSGVSLGGVHGHGCRDTEGLPGNLAMTGQMKFAMFLERIKKHGGVPWIEATHGNTDKESKWIDAQDILAALDRKQKALGLPAVSIRELEPEEQDVRPTSKKNKTHHNYFNACFFRREFLVALFGGPQPIPGCKVSMQPPAKMARLGEGMTDMDSLWSSWGSKSPEQLMESMASMFAAAAGAQRSCWDMMKKGKCPRANCKYCEEDARRGMTTKKSTSAEQAQQDDACWDMQKKGVCPRGDKCKYCNAGGK